MSKTRFTVLLALSLSFLLSFSALGAETQQDSIPEKSIFTENNADMQVYRTDFDDLYQVNVDNGAKTEIFYEKTTNGCIYALMVNGSFVPYPSLLTSDGTLYISADKLSWLIGNEADSETFERNTYTFEKNGNSIQVNSYSRSAVINGVETEIEAFSSPLYNYDGNDENIYVPLRHIIEALGGTVEYVQDFEKTYGDGLIGSYDTAVNMAIIEMPPYNDEVYTIEEGLEILMDSSKETYEYVKSYLTETGRSFSNVDPDYDPTDIKYIGSMGRYYVYHLNNFEGLPLMINKYTGEMFSGKPGLPFISISKGFPNIGWLYQ